LPPDSPDLNPIEHIWAQLKAIGRKLRCDVDTFISVYLRYDFYMGLAISQEIDLDKFEEEVVN